MLALSSETSAAIALHAAEHSWVVFMQTELPGGIGAGRIKIEGLKGKQLASRFTTISRECPYPIHLIGMVTTNIDPRDHVEAIATEHVHAHDGWFEPTADLIAFISHVGQEPLRDLLGLTHPGAIGNSLVDIEQIAEMLGVSVVTIRRMIDRREIPTLKVGRAYRFNPSDVLASLQQR